MSGDSKRWTRRGADFFRSDMAYAGKDHAKNNKTFIALGPTGWDEIGGFKTVESAMRAADEKWPII